MVRAGAALLVILLSTGCASTRAAQRAESHQRARSLLAQVESTPDLLETFHTDPRVLDAIGIFLRAEDAENLSDADMNERVRHVFPNPPWDWVPAIEFRRVKSGLYFAHIAG